MVGELWTSSCLSGTWTSNKVGDWWDDTSEPLFSYSILYIDIEEEEDPSSYNINEIFESFTFILCKKEVSRKRIRNEKQNDGTLKEIQEDEVLFEKTDEDLNTVATTSTTLSQVTAHNVTMLSEKISQAESDNDNLKNEIISLKT